MADHEHDDDDTVIPAGRRSRGLDWIADEPDDDEPAPQRYYRFRVGDSPEVVALDRVTYLGRNPRPPRIAAEPAPRLVTVPSSRREVSSTHIELRQVGSSVVVTDLKSTNGTFVTVPGGAPRKLRQGESAVATPGTVVDIGDGNLIEILPMRLLV